jgi:hypothetical protein
MTYPIDDTERATFTAMAKLNFRGNLVPDTWFGFLTHDNGKPNLVAIILLSDITYWYRPTVNADGEVCGKRFKADLLEKNHRELISKFGFTPKQVRDALKFLEARGLVTLQRRTVPTRRRLLHNVLFIGLNVPLLAEITNPGLDAPRGDRRDLHGQEDNLQVMSSDPQVADGDLQGNRAASRGNTYTESTTQTSTHNRQKTSQKAVHRQQHGGGRLSVVIYE